MQVEITSYIIEAHQPEPSMLFHLSMFSICLACTVVLAVSFPPRVQS